MIVVEMDVIVHGNHPSDLQKNVMSYVLANFAFKHK